jgi:hypothetical protein
MSFEIGIVFLEEKGARRSVRKRALSRYSGPDDHGCGEKNRHPVLEGNLQSDFSPAVDLEGDIALHKTSGHHALIEAGEIETAVDLAVSE